MASPLQMTEMYDHALLGVLQHVGNIQDFLQVYFGFLYRKTDFYRRLARPTDRMGFPPGAAQSMVLKTFKLFERMAEQDRERQQTEESTRLVPPPMTIQEVEVEPPQRNEEAAGETSSSSSSSARQSAAVAAHKTEASSSSSSSGTMESSPSSSSSSSGPQLLPPTSSAPVQTSTSQGDQRPGASAKSSADAGQEKFQSDPESYNGAVRENYTWSQDYTDVEVRVKVPKTVVKGKQVVVDLQSSSVRVSLKDGAEDSVLVEGELTHKINPEESLWNLEPGRCVVLTLSKIGEVWWSALLKGEPEIDIQQINRERSMATVGEDEHAVLDRLTFDYNQKLQGKPQSHEMKVHEMLKKGWDAEGSPFRGQQFDPTMFDIPPSAVQF